MSLTEDIAELVDSANHLTDEVSGKIAEIDQKNEEFINSFDDNLKNLTSRYFYLDANEGNNDNPGTEELPCRSFHGIRHYFSIGGSYTIRVKGKVELDTHIILDNTTVIIETWADDNAGIEQVVFETVEETDGTKEKAGYFSLRNSFVYIFRINLFTAKSISYPISHNYSFFSRQDTAYGHVSIYEKTLTINDNDFFYLASGPDYKSLSIYNAHIKQNTNKQLIVCENGNLVAKLTSITLDDDISLKDLISGVKYDTNGIAYNLITNVESIARS